MRYALDLWNNGFKDFEKDFERLFTGLPVPAARTRGQGLECDLVETTNEYLVTLDVPGVTKEDLNIELQDRNLTISGEKKTEKRSEDAHTHLSERFYGKFSRTFVLPNTVDTKNIEAQYENGVLKIALPKIAEAQPMQIKIRDKAH